MLTWIHRVVVSCNWEWIHTVMKNHGTAVIAGKKPKLVANFKASKVPAYPIQSLLIS